MISPPVLYSKRRLLFQRLRGTRGMLARHHIHTVGGFFFLHNFRKVSFGRFRPIGCWWRDEHFNLYWTVWTTPTRFTVAFVQVVTKLEANSITIYCNVAYQHFNWFIINSYWIRKRVLVSIQHLLTPWPEHSRLLWFVGHLVWSMCGKILEQVWLRQMRFSPHGVPSQTRPIREGSIASSALLDEGRWMDLK